jgi:Zn-dependent protease with chaperone function
MPISANTYIEMDSQLPMPAQAGKNLISINPDLFMLFNGEECKWMLGHESRHVYHDDVITNTLCGMALPFISYGILKLYSNSTGYLLNTFQNKFDRDSKMYQCLGTLKTINTAISHNVITHICLQQFLYSMFGRFQELRADRESHNC